MTVSHRKPRPVQPNQDRSTAEPGVRYHCDVCGADITLTVRIRCAGGCKDFDLCGTCFCTGAQVGSHKAYHDYRVIEQHSQPIFCRDWGVDEELLLIDGCQLYGVGNWADVADHIGNRTKEEVERHFINVYIEGKNGLPSGDQRAADAVLQWRAAHPQEKQRCGEERLPVMGPDLTFAYDIPIEDFQRERCERIERLREMQAAFVPPKPPAKPLVSAPTSHSELAGFMPGRLEFEQEYEQDAEHLVKDMEFGRVYSFGGDQMPNEYDALGAQGATQGHARMEASGRGGPVTQPSQEEVAETLAEAQEPQAADAANTGEADGEAGAKKSGVLSEQEEKAAEQTDDRAPDWDEDPMDLELKLAVLDMYDEQLERRAQKKHFLFERNLVDYRRNIGAERRRPKEERDLLARIKHFATMQTANDFEDFYRHLCYEEALKRTVRQLQHYRRMGITTFAEAAQYDKEAAERTKRQLEATEGSISALNTLGTGHGRARHRERGVSTMEEAHAKDDAFSFASAPGIQLLSLPEQQLCSALHILPQPYLMLKTALLTYSFAHNKALTLEYCQRISPISPRKLQRLYDFFLHHGYLHAVKSAHDWPQETPHSFTPMLRTV
ncbi:Ada2p [Malassezia vespertilionis]|uniref:Transcriptional adapter 2 n=1 Tax=Malassezia vespertilionis TaxID=2020962 RepID=A0A2N1JB14_9BASI|nr:Ada2p [Malassezia vespertilionis]